MAYCFGLGTRGGQRVVRAAARARAEGFRRGRHRRAAILVRPSDSLRARPVPDTLFIEGPVLEISGDARLGRLV
jgi:hypothetical protein